MSNLYIQELFMIINNHYFNYLILFSLSVYISFIQNKMVSNNTLFKNIFFKIFSLLIIIFISEKNKILGLLLSILYIMNIVTLNAEGLDLINDYEKFIVPNSTINKKKKIVNKQKEEEKDIVKNIYNTCSVIHKSCINNNKQLCIGLNRDINTIYDITKRMRKKVDNQYKERIKNLNEFNYFDKPSKTIEEILKI